MIASLSSERTQFKNLQAATHRRMAYLNLPTSIQERVDKYFEVLWDRHRCSDTSKLAAFTTMLSQPLQKEVLLALNRDIVKNVSAVQVVLCPLTVFFLLAHYCFTVV